jgi:ribonuclease-3
MSSDLPYNETNIVISETFITDILKQHGVVCNKIPLNFLKIYRQSMVHKSYCTRRNENFIDGNLLCPTSCIPLQEESNERLEFLGDAVISLIVGKYLYNRYQDKNEGFLTKMRTKLVNGNMLAELSGVCNLGKYLIISKQIEENNGRSNKKLLEDVFESFIGAMITHIGYDEIEKWYINLIEDSIDFSDLVLSNTNYKDTFIKLYQNIYNTLPKFCDQRKIKEACGKNNIVYSIYIKDNKNKIIASGIGETKKLAENDAAKNAIKIISSVSD